MPRKWGSRSHFTHADIHAAADSYASGVLGIGVSMSLVEAASMVPCNRMHLMRYLKEHNMPLRPRGRPVQGEL